MIITQKEVLPNLLEQIEQDIEELSSDGGYDTFDCDDAIAQQGARL